MKLTTCRYFSTFLHNYLVMYASTNKQNINFQNCFGVLCLLCQRKS